MSQTWAPHSAYTQPVALQPSASAAVTSMQGVEVELGPAPAPRRLEVDEAAVQQIAHVLLRQAADFLRLGDALAQLRRQAARDLNSLVEGPELRFSHRRPR